eukprot:gene1597-1691_t
MSEITAVKISVRDPTKSNDKFGSFISYKVTSQITRSGVQAPATTVERRYSDFTWLSNEFLNEFPGAIIPALPDKQTVGRFNTEFVESRRRGLERFLKRVSVHPDLVQSPSFASFLEADEPTFLKLKEQSSQRKPKLTSSAFNWIDKTVQTIANGKLELEKSAADTKVEEITAYIFQVEKQMTAMLKHAEGLVKKNRETSQVLFELGQSISLFGQGEADGLGKALNEMGTSLDSLSATAASHAEAETIQFLETIDEYVRMIGSIKTAIQQRQAKKDVYLQAMGDLEAKTAAYRKLVGTPGKESQAKAKEQLMQSAQEVFDGAKLEFEKVTERLLSEFEAFKAQRALDMKEIMVDFVSLQLENNKRTEEQWQSLLPKLQLSSLDGNDYTSLDSKLSHHRFHDLPTHSSNPFHDDSNID